MVMGLLKDRLFVWAGLGCLRGIRRAIPHSAIVSQALDLLKVNLLSLEQPSCILCFRLRPERGHETGLEIV